MDWGPIDQTPYPGEPGGLPADITGDPSGGLDDLTVVLPESAVQLVEPDGTHVAWLAKAKGWTYRRGNNDPGSGSVTLARSDPLVEEAVFPRQLRFFDRGVLRARSLIGPTSHTTVSQGEESNEEVTVGGPGALALPTRGRVDPLRPALKPKQGSVRFNFAHPDYDDTVDGWEPVAVLDDFGVPTDWPGGGTTIWGPSGDNEFAPGGSVYFRAPAPFTLASPQVIAAVWEVDNVGTLYLNGVEIDALAILDSNNYLDTHERRYFLDAGDHYPAATGFNQGPSTEPGNPGHIRITFHEIDSNGQLGDIIASTTGDWLAYEFPQSRPPELTRPGWTAGQIIPWLLDRWEARGADPVARSFTEFLDSDGATWPVIVDFTAPIGSLFDALRSLAEVHCDLDWSPGDDEIHAWLKDTHGGTTTDEFPSGYSGDPDACILELSHDVEPPLLTSALVEWRDGFVIVENEAAPVLVERKIDAPLVDTEAAAEVIGGYGVAVFGVARVRGTGRLIPRSDTQRPGVGFDVGDTRNLPDRTLALVPQVIQSYTHTATIDGVIGWTIEFGDQMFNQEERFGHWLAGIANGSLGGRTFQVTPYRQEVLPPAEPSGRQALIFHRLEEDATGESDPWPIDDYQTIQAVTVTVPNGEGATVDLIVNGSVIDSFTVGASVTDPVTEPWLTYKLEPGDGVSVSTDDAVAVVVVVRVR